MTSEQPKPAATPPPSTGAPQVVKNVDPGQLRHFVTTIKTAEAQVGENIIQALHHPETVAVLTTVVMGPDGQQRVVSAALDPEMMSEVQNVLARAQESREPEEPCIGFHCLVKPKTDRESKENTAE